MAVFDTSAALMFERNLATMGDAAVYTPIAGGPAVSLMVWIDTEQILEIDAYEAQVYTQADTIEYVMTDIGAEANKGDVFAVGDYLYTVQRPMENDGYTVKCQVRKTAA
jgi:hypothetical protein